MKKIKPDKREEKKVSVAEVLKWNMENKKKKWLWFLIWTDTLGQVDFWNHDIALNLEVGGFTW